MGIKRRVHQSIMKIFPKLTKLEKYILFYWTSQCFNLARYFSSDGLPWVNRTFRQATNQQNVCANVLSPVLTSTHSIVPIPRHWRHAPPVTYTAL